MEKRLPFPISDSTAIYPSKRSAITLQMDSPKAGTFGEFIQFRETIENGVLLFFRDTNAVSSTRKYVHAALPLGIHNQSIYIPFA